MAAGLKEKQLEIVALMNSWVFSRLIAENEKAGESLSREMDAVAEAEREQGRSFSPRLVLTGLPSSCHGPVAGPMALHESLRVRTESTVNISALCSLRKHCFCSGFILMTHLERMRVQLEQCVSNIRAALATLSRAVM